MAPRNAKLLFLERALKALKKELPDATDAERLQAAQKLTDLEFEPATSRAARETAESVKARELSLQEQAAAEAKAEAERIANPQGLVEKVIGPKGSPRRDTLRQVGIPALVGGGVQLINTVADTLGKSADTVDAPPPATAPSGKAPLTPSAAQVSDFLNSIQNFNAKLRGQALRRRIMLDFEGAERLEAQQIDPAKALQDYREGSRTDFGYGTERKIEEQTAGYEAEQKLERIRQDTERVKQEAENKRKVLDLAGQVIKSTEGSMNIDLLPQRQY